MADSDLTVPRAARRPPSFDVLPPGRCLELLSTTTVGRIAFTGREGPVLLPVKYRIVDDAVVVRTSRSGTLGQLAGSDVEVVFEVDYHAPMARSAWSVLVRGTTTVVEDARSVASVEVSRVVSWVPGDHSLVLSIPIERVTGRSVG
jgi:nitroimidazol reductase NimA-like FMN-containing flavoprotein (pyridoxamine 5'-phosphate oxidase superfamily)